MKADTKRQLRRLLFWTSVGAATGAIIGGGIGPAIIDPPLVGAGVVALVAGIDTAAIAASIGGLEIFLPKTRLGRTLDNAPYLVSVVLKVFAYGVVIVAVSGGGLGDHVLNASGLGGYIAHATRLRVKLTPAPEVMVATAIVPVILFGILLQLIRLVGDRTVRNIVLGRYHRPHLEERFVLFVDIVGSTPLAERLGPAAVHDFLNRVFQTASGPIDDYLGEVYQYVGDEIVITWTVAEGRASALPLACFFAVDRALERLAHDFERDFGAVPRLRAALHAGPVIAGEVGGSRRSIVFHGDVMNTASRLENATRDLQRPFLVSEDALRRLEGSEAYALEDLGPQQLRGRAAPMRVYAVAAERGVPVSNSSN